MTDSNLQSKRLAAAGIDAAIFLVMGALMSLGVLAVGCIAGWTNVDFLATYGPGIVIVVMLTIELVYVLGRDVLAGGRSIGKKLMNIRVVGASGGPVTFGESLKRNMLFAPGLALALIGAILGLLPLGVGCLMQCLLWGPRMLAGLFALGAVGWEIYQIVSQPEGIRQGDKMAGTRVTW
jgi:uncharacterized RDD family membrane protein YckC